MGDIVRLPNAALTDDELLENLLAEIPAPPPGFYVTREQRRARYERLAREGKARAARDAFRVVN